MEDTEDKEQAAKERPGSSDEYIVRHLEAVQARYGQVQGQLGPAFQEGLKRAKEIAEAYDLGPLPENLGQIEGNSRNLAQAAAKVGQILKAVSSEVQLQGIAAGLSRFSEQISALVNADLFPATATFHEVTVTATVGVGASVTAAPVIVGTGAVTSAPTEGQVVWRNLAWAAVYLVVAIGVAYGLDQTDLATVWQIDLNAILQAMLWAHFYYKIGKK
jgi:hypothetical protein